MTADQPQLFCPEGEFAASPLIVDDDLDMLSMLERIVRKNAGAR